jgi:hypothetical protein
LALKNAILQGQSGKMVAKGTNSWRGVRRNSKEPVVTLKVIFKARLYGLTSE